MYIETRLMSETIGHIDSLMHYLCGFEYWKDMIENERLPNDIYNYSDAIDGVIRVMDSIQEEVNTLSSLYPATNFQSHFQRIIDATEGVKWLVTEYVREWPECLFYPNCKLSTHGLRLLESVGTMNSVLKEHIATTMPLSGLPTNAITPELVAQNSQAAIQYAFTHLEDLLRQRIGVKPDVFGQSLINKAFGDRGCLTYGATQAEDIGVRNLMSGAYSTFRNPHMHRIIGNDEQMVKTILTLVDLLTKLVDDAKDKS